MATQIPLTKILQAIDMKDKGFYDRLSEEEKKAFNPFVLTRYASNSDGSPELCEWWLRATNIRVNKNYFDLYKHPKLQWLSLTTASPGMGTTFHRWIPHKKKDTKNTASNKILKTLRILYPAAKEDEIELLASINTKAEIKAHLKDLGYDDKQIKEML